MDFIKYFSAIDTQIGGETFRIVTHSPIRIAGADIQTAQEQLDHEFLEEKNFLLNEPRGHRGINGCLVLPSARAHIGLLFFQHEGGKKFKYEAVLAVVSALIETGALKYEEVIKVDTASGIYSVTVKGNAHEVAAVSIDCEEVDVLEVSPGGGKVKIASNRQYVVCTLPETIPALTVEHLGAIQRWGNTEAKKQFQQPEDVGVVLVEEGTHAEEVRTVTFDRDGYILRSPGVDSSLAVATLRGQSRLKNTSLFEEAFVVNQSKAGDGFSFEGTSFVTSIGDFTLDADDPLPNGFIMI